MTRISVNLLNSIFLIIPEESMTQEDEDLMLDNFVTFFIAGEFELFLLGCIKMLQNKQKVLNLILIDFSWPTYLITVEIKNTMT